MAACNVQVEAGSYAVASIVHSLVASDDEGSFLHLEAKIAAVAANAVTVEADSELYAIAFVALVEQFSVDGEAIETPTRCPDKKLKAISENQ